MRVALRIVLLGLAVACGLGAAEEPAKVKESDKRIAFNDLYRKGQAKEALATLQGCTERDSLTLIAKMAAGEPNGALANEALDMLFATDDPDTTVAQMIAMAWQGATSFDRKVAYAARLTALTYKFHGLGVMVQYVAEMDYPESSKEAADRIQREINGLAQLVRKNMSLMGKIRALEAELEAIKKNPEKYDAKHNKYKELVASIGKLAGTTFTVDRKFPKYIAAWWGTNQSEYMNQDRITLTQKKKAAEEAKKQAAGK